MNYDISQPVPQGSDGAQDAENSRIAAIADQLERLCAIHEAQRGDSLKDVSRFETEQRAAEQMAKSQGFWIPMMDVFNLGVPGPSGNENDTYVGEKVIYKVNNLLNSGSIVALLRKILMHNQIFPDTAYSFRGFAGFDGRTVQPIIIQPRIANARPATRIMIETYMAAIGFEKTAQEGRFRNGQYEVWDVVPRNVLVDEEGDIFVIDAEIKQIS
ncbi:MAG: hypothetical protein IJJ68_00915 [Prevotella sp.]|nr:hypothetical protein [Prevotella sp.]MBR4368251.1 hypothetical protein [Prevotella sp.]